MCRWIFLVRQESRTDFLGILAIILCAIFGEIIMFLSKSKTVNFSARLHKNNTLKKKSNFYKL